MVKTHARGFADLPSKIALYMAMFTCWSFPGMYVMWPRNHRREFKYKFWSNGNAIWNKLFFFGFKWYKFIILQFWGQKYEMGPTMTKIKVLAGLCSFWRLQERSHSFSLTSWSSSLRSIVLYIYIYIFFFFYISIMFSHEWLDVVPWLSHFAVQ